MKDEVYEDNEVTEFEADKVSEVVEMKEREAIPVGLSRRPPENEVFDIVYGDLEDEPDEDYDSFVEKMRENSVSAFSEIRKSLQESAKRNKKHCDVEVEASLVKDDKVDDASAKADPIRHWMNRPMSSDERNESFEIRTPAVDSNHSNISLSSCEVAVEVVNSTSQRIVIDNAEPADEPSTQFWLLEKRDGS